MAKKIIPIKPPYAGKIRPITAEEFRMENSTVGEKFLFDLIGSEHAKFSGTTIEFYNMDRERTQVDPLYGEAVEKVWVGPYKLIGHIEWPDPRPENREEGYRTTHIASAWIARTEFEQAHLEWPSRGDIVRVWSIPFFDAAAVDDESTPNAGYYFNIVNVQDDGHMFTNADFAGFKLELRRYSEFVPERRIFPPE
jgi:hypothetical protein